MMKEAGSPAGYTDAESSLKIVKQGLKEITAIKDLLK
jgi:hypothetical protein